MYRMDGMPVLVQDQQAAALERLPLDSRQPGGYDEGWLQRLLFDHPSCLPIEEIEPGFGTPVSACMEMPTPHGPIDLMLLTPEGDIILVEAKLWRNPQARREVVAQSLDYASCLFEMGFEEFERAIHKGDHGGRPKPSRLVEIFPEGERPDEVTFVDAVSSNLRQGRIMIIVVGDGIRTETERLSDALQSHAGFHFTFALVELQVYQMPGSLGMLVHPRTLAKTCMINRGVVTVDDRRVAVAAPLAATIARETRASTITAERFWEAMANRGPDVPDRLKAFLTQLEEIGVHPEFRKSLILRWSPPEGKPINLGYIMTNGQLWTDAANWVAPHELSHPYIEEVAAAFAGYVEKDRSENWHVRIDGKAPRIEAVIDHFDAWYDAIARFVERLREHYAEQVP